MGNTLIILYTLFLKKIFKFWKNPYEYSYRPISSRNDQNYFDAKLYSYNKPNALDAAKWIRANVIQVWMNDSYPVNFEWDTASQTAPAQVNLTIIYSLNFKQYFTKMKKNYETKYYLKIRLHNVFNFVGGFLVNFFSQNVKKIKNKNNNTYFLESNSTY